MSHLIKLGPVHIYIYIWIYPKYPAYIAEEVVLCHVLSVFVTVLYIQQCLQLERAKFYTTLHLLLLQECQKIRLDSLFPEKKKKVCFGGIRPKSRSSLETIEKRG